MRIVMLLLLLMLPLNVFGSSSTASMIIDDLRASGIYFDEGRFPDATLQGFINDITQDLAVTGFICKKEYVLSLSNGVQTYLLPSDFILHESVDLNGDPTTSAGDYNYRRVLTFVNTREFGKGFEFTKGRPEYYTIWWDSLARPYIQISPPEQPSKSDTLFIKYYYMPDSISSTSDTLNIAEQYVPLVRERLRQICLQRVVFTAPDPQATYELLQELKKALLGRPSDAGYRQDYIQPTIDNQ